MFREANFCVDALARKGLLQDDDFVVFETPSFEINSFVISDNNGLYYSRLTTATS